MSGNPLKLSPPTNLEARGAEIEHLHREISVGREDNERMENLRTDKDYLIEALEQENKAVQHRNEILENKVEQFSGIP